MKNWLIILFAKCFYVLSRLLGRQGTTITGAIALRLNPFILMEMSKKIQKIVFITGTNGKTTTSNLLASVLNQTDQTVIHNKEGANMLTGVTSTFIKASNFWGRVTADVAVLEVDEGSLPKIIEQLPPTHIVILNFFRDQLDRYGEIDGLIKNMMEAIRPVETELLLNADDPLVMQFSALNKKITPFGLEEGILRFTDYAQGESVHCPYCGVELTYNAVHYGQLGHFACSCGFMRIKPKYEINSIQSASNLSFTMNKMPYFSSLKGNFNIYNIMAALATAYEIGTVEYEQIQKGLSKYATKNGRMETFYHKGLPYVLNLTKNPSGTNVIFNELLNDTNPKQLLIILNDNVADGEDISWIWDVEFEHLNREDIKTIVCAGTRSSELALRLHYADISNGKIKDISNIQAAIEYTLAHPLQTYILPTYTALEKAKEDLVRKVQPV